MLNLSLLVSPANPSQKPSGATSASTSAKSNAENRKIDKSAKDFESLLLGSWLQKAYESFGSLPGDDSGDELGAGSEQFQGIAMQGLASSITNAGGIGIAKIMADHLRKAAHPSAGSQDPIPPIPAVSTLPVDSFPASIETDDTNSR